MDVYDVIIIGGGPAGLNAAMVLGRCLRKVLIFDHGQQRNRYSHGMHNYLTRDDVSPAEFLKISRKELKKYGVEIKQVEIKHAKKSTDEIFEVTDCDENIYYSKKLILATGLTDKLPEVEGINKFYGKSIYHCPYCDGWENKGKSIGVYAPSKDGIDVALTLKAWSEKITLYTNGKQYLTTKYQEIVSKNKIEVITDPIRSFEGRGKQLKNIVFENGQKSFCEALFSRMAMKCNAILLKALDVIRVKNNIALSNKSQQTNVPGLYVAGDLSKDMHFVVVAAAEGAKAGVYINKELTQEGQL